MSRMKKIEVRFDTGRAYMALPTSSGMAGKNRWLIYRIDMDLPEPVASLDPKQRTGVFSDVTPGRVFDRIEELEWDEVLKDKKSE